MKKTFFNKKLSALTMMEMLAVMGIAGLLFLVCMPLVEPLFSKARSMEAKEQLHHLHMLEKSYYYEHSKYTSDLGQLGFEHAKLKTDAGGTANYRIEVAEAGLTNYKAKAIAVIDFDNDGNFNTWEIDENQNLQEVVPD